MSEREKTKSKEQQEEVVEVEVAIHGKYIGTVKVKKGSTLQDVLDKLVEKLGLKREDLNNMTITLNGKEIKFENGKLVENPVVNERATLVLLKKFVGGPKQGSRDDFFVRLNNLLRKGFFDGHISARNYNLSEKHLRRIYKKETGLNWFN